MYFKFKENDVYINRIKAHPRVNFFIHSGTVYYNNKPKIVQDSTKWAFLGEQGAFNLSYIANEILTARTNGTGFWCLSIFQSPSVTAGAPHWSGRNVSLNGKWGQRIENGEIRSWVQSTVPANQIFDLDTSGPYGTVDPEMLLCIDSVSASTATFSWYTSNSSKTVGTYSRSNLPSDFDRYMVGARNSGGIIDNHLGGYYFAHIFGAGENLTSANAAQIQSAFNTSQDTLLDKIEHTVNTVKSISGNGNIKFAAIFTEGFTPISGTAPTVSGTISYRRFV